MAIVKEFFRTRKDGINLYKIYSNVDLYIRKTGTEEMYTEVIDIENAPYEYEETEEKIKKEEEDAE